MRCFVEGEHADAEAMRCAHLHTLHFIAMNPIHFGSRDRLLFGVYHVPEKGGSKGVVLCYPWGQEYLRAHRSFAYLARTLSAAGLHVLRFDYYGSGDSAGDSTDTSVSSWIADVGVAIDELKDMSGLRSVSLAGLRLGGAVAALTATSRTDVSALVLWDPILDGRKYMKELLVANGYQGDGDPRTDGYGNSIDVMGFPLTREMEAEFAGVGNCLEWPDLPSTLVVITETSLSTDGALAQASPGNSNVLVEYHAGPNAWSGETDFGTAGMPVDALRRITKWLAD